MWHLAAHKLSVSQLRVVASEKLVKPAGCLMEFQCPEHTCDLSGSGLYVWHADHFEHSQKRER